MHRSIFDIDLSDRSFHPGQLSLSIIAVTDGTIWWIHSHNFLHSRFSLLKQNSWTFGPLRQTNLFFNLSMDYVETLEKQSKAPIAQLT